MFRRIATTPFTAIRKAARPHGKTVSVFAVGETTVKRSPYLPETAGQRIKDRTARNVTEFAPALAVLRTRARKTVLGKFSESIRKQAPAHTARTAHTLPPLATDADIDINATFAAAALWPLPAYTLDTHARAKGLSTEQAAEMSNFAARLYQHIEQNSDANRTQASKQWEMARVLSSDVVHFEMFLALTGKHSIHGERFKGEAHTVAVRKEAHRQELGAAQQLIDALHPADQKNITPAELHALASAAHTGDFSAIAPMKHGAVNALAAHSLAVKAFLCAHAMQAPAPANATPPEKTAHQQNLHANIAPDLRVAFLFYRNGFKQEGENTPLAEALDRIFALRHKWLPRGHANRWSAGFANVLGYKKSPMHAIAVTNSAADAERGHQHDGNPRLNWNLDDRDTFERYVNKLIAGIDIIANQSKKGDTPEFTNGGTFGANVSVAGAMEFVTSLLFPGFSFSIAPDVRATRGREAFFSAGSNNFRAHLNMGVSTKKTYGLGISGSAGAAAPGSTGLLGFFAGLTARAGGTYESVERTGVTFGHKLKKTGGMVYDDGQAVAAHDEWREALKQMARVLLLAPDDQAGMLDVIAAAYFSEPDFSLGQVSGSNIDISINATVGIRAQFAALMHRFGGQLVAGFSASVFNRSKRRETGARTGSNDMKNTAAHIEASAAVTLGLPSIDNATLAGMSLFKVSQNFRGKGVGARLQNVEDEGGLETDSLYLELNFRNVNDYIAYILTNANEHLDTFDDGEAIRHTVKNVRKKVTDIREELSTSARPPLERLKMARKGLQFELQRIKKLKLAALEFRANVEETRQSLAAERIGNDWQMRLPNLWEVDALIASLNTSKAHIKAALTRCKAAKNEPPALQTLDNPDADFFNELKQSEISLRQSKTAAAVFCNPHTRTSRNVAAYKINLTLERMKLSAKSKDGRGHLSYIERRKLNKPVADRIKDLRQKMLESHDAAAVAGWQANIDALMVRADSWTPRALFTMANNQRSRNRGLSFFVHATANNSVTCAQETTWVSYSQNAERGHLLR